MKTKAFLCLGFLLALASCYSDDEGYDTSYPSAISELVEVNIGSDSLAVSFTNDAGATYAISQSIKAEVPDTAFRCYCTYAVSKDKQQSAEIFELSSILSSLPQRAEQMDSIAHDPVHITSSWCSPRYLNMYFSFKTTGKGAHRFGFCEDSIAVAANGQRVAFISLLHKRPTEDPESFSQPLYLSLPTYAYADRADSIVLSVNTYDGVKQFGKRL